LLNIWLNIDAGILSLQVNIKHSLLSCSFCKLVRFLSAGEMVGLCNVFLWRLVKVMF